MWLSMKSFLTSSDSWNSLASSVKVASLLLMVGVPADARDWDDARSTVTVLEPRGSGARRLWNWVEVVPDGVSYQIVPRVWIPMEDAGAFHVAI